MNAIKFSHFYNKIGLAFKVPSLLYFQQMQDCLKRATLLDVLEVNIEELSLEFLAYDTTFTNTGAKNTEDDPFLGQYTLPKSGAFLLLIFLGPYGIFTTLRRKTPEKHGYYAVLIGEQFEVVIEPGIKFKQNPAGRYDQSLFDKPSDQLSNLASS